MDPARRLDVLLQKLQRLGYRRIICRPTMREQTCRRQCRNSHTNLLRERSIFRLALNAQEVDCFGRNCLEFSAVETDSRFLVLSTTVPRGGGHGGGSSEEHPAGKSAGRKHCMTPVGCG